MTTDLRLITQHNNTEQCSYSLIQDFNFQVQLTMMMWIGIYQE